MNRKPQLALAKLVDGKAAADPARIPPEPRYMTAKAGFGCMR
jgi:hypothetical protein